MAREALGRARRLPAEYRRLLKFCRGRVRSPDDAPDLAQDAYLRLILYRRSADVYDEEGLLRRIALNLGINRWRRVPPVSRVPRSVEDIDAKVGIADGRPGPDRILAAEQELRVVAEYLDAVSHQTSWIFIAQRAGYSYAEVAQACGLKARTIEKHVARGAEIVSALRQT